MKLSDIELHGFGKFFDEPAAFRCAKYHLPAHWDYVYTNGDVLLRPSGWLIASDSGPNSHNL